MAGCVTPVIGPSINEAAIRVLTRHGIEVVLPQGQACCGGVVHHMGREHDALAAVRRNIDAWIAEADGEGLDAIVITASGCGTTVKDYGFMLRSDAAYAAKAQRISALAKDICEYLAGLDIRAPAGRERLRDRLSRRLFSTAWTENYARAERIAFQKRLRSQRCAGRTFVLWIGGNLQHP